MTTLTEAKPENNSHVEVKRDGHILEVKLNKPKVNAIDVAMSREIGEAFAELRDDPELRVGILTAEGERIFSAGWDLKSLNDGEAKLDNWWEADDYGDGGFAGLTENWNLNKPVIAAVNGLAIGGGFELVMGCDLIIAAEHVEFALPEMPLGIVPDAGALQRLPRRIPYHIAVEMLLLGRRIAASEAAHYGLINKVVKKEDFDGCGAGVGRKSGLGGAAGDANRQRGAPPYRMRALGTGFSQNA